MYMILSIGYYSLIAYCLRFMQTCSAIMVLLIDMGPRPRTKAQEAVGRILGPSSLDLWPRSRAHIHHGCVV